MSVHIWLCKYVGVGVCVYVRAYLCSMYISMYRCMCGSVYLCTYLSSTCASVFTVNFDPRPDTPHSPHTPHTPMWWPCPPYGYLPFIAVTKANILNCTLYDLRSGPNLFMNHDSTKAKWTKTHPPEWKVAKLECLYFIAIYGLHLIPFHWVEVSGCSWTWSTNACIQCLCGFRLSLLYPHDPTFSVDSAGDAMEIMFTRPLLNGFFPLLATRLIPQGWNHDTFWLGSHMHGPRPPLLVATFVYLAKYSDRANLCLSSPLHVISESSKHQQVNHPIYIICPVLWEFTRVLHKRPLWSPYRSQSYCKNHCCP